MKGANYWFLVEENPNFEINNKQQEWMEGKIDIKQIVFSYECPVLWSIYLQYYSLIVSKLKEEVFQRGLDKTKMQDINHHSLTWMTHKKMILFTTIWTLKVDGTIEFRFNSVCLWVLADHL